MTLVKNVCRFGLIAAIGIFSLTACSGAADKRDAKAAASSLINENKSIVAFGHVSVKELLDKLDYKQLPKVNAILSAEIPSWEKGLDLKTPVYYALQAPFAKDGTPDVFYGFLNVKDKAKLLDKFTSMGYTMEKTGEISYFSEDDVTIGVRNDLAIVISKKDDYDGKAMIEKAFKETEGDESDGKAEDILDEKGDIVAGISIERLYTTSNTSLSKLPEAKKTELEKMIKDGYVQTVATFKKGEARIESKNLFSDELKDRLFFKEDANATVLKKLGNGTAWMGISANIDMRKLESFMTDFAPGANEKLNEKLPGEATMALAMLGENPLGKMFSGQLGFVAVGNPSVEGMLPQFNFFVGLGSKGDFITNMIGEYAGMAMMQKQGDAYIIEGMAIAPRKDGLYGYTTGNGAGGLKIPAFAKGFGTKTFSMFMNLGSIDVKSLELEPQQRVLEIMESLVINVDRDGGELVLVSKDKSRNILKQIGLFYVEMGEEKMNELQDGALSDAEIDAMLDEAAAK